MSDDPVRVILPLQLLLHPVCIFLSVVVNLWFDLVLFDSLRVPELDLGSSLNLELA